MPNVNFNSFELIEKYLPKAVDKYFMEESKTAVLEQGTKFIDVNFDQTGYVKIASILMDGLSDYYRAQSFESTNNPAYADYAGNIGSGYRDGFHLGNVSVKWEIFKLQWCRGKQFKIDYIQDEETAGIIIGNAVEEFNRLKVVPEVDACRFSVIADTCSVSLGNLVNEAPDSDDDDGGILHRLNAAFQWLAENEVPSEEQLLFVSNEMMTQIRNSKELTKFLTQGDYRSPAGIDFTVEKYMNRPIIEVPPSRFYTNVLVVENGYRPDASKSKAINYMVVSKKAVVPIRKLEWQKVYGPEMSGIIGFHGYIINELLYHGVVIPENKIAGVYTSYNNSVAATTKANLLRVDTREGATQYSWKVKTFFTNPAGLRGYLVYKPTSAFTLGGDITSVGTAGTDYFVPTIGQDIAEDAGSKTYYFALVDGAGTIIAVSGAVAVQQHA